MDHGECSVAGSHEPLDGLSECETSKDLGQETTAELFQTFISSNSEVWQEVSS